MSKHALMGRKTLEIKLMDTIMAPMTPVQISPVIILRISGPQVADLPGFFGLEKLEPRISTRAAFSSKINTQVADDVLLLYFKAPASYTGEDVLEISFHGNPLIVNQAMEDFSAIGIRMAEPGEFSRRAFVNGKMSFSQVEAVNALIHSPTKAGISSARQSLLGGLDSIFQTVRSDLLIALAEIEAAIDFSEELHELEEKSIHSRLEKSKLALEKLLDSYQDAQRAMQGVEVVIAGAPNAGKSTLFNLLLGAERAIVSDEAGTTRDLITEQLQMGSARLKLTDTAGMRKSASAAESEGVRRAKSALDKADLILFLIDSSQAIPTEIFSLLNMDKDKIVVGTKADLPRADNGIDYDICVSAADAKSVQALRSMLGEKISKMLPDEDFGPALMAETQRIGCAECLAEISQLNDEMPLDMQAFHLRRAAEALDRTQGVNLTEEVLDKLFANFCIGK